MLAKRLIALFAALIIGCSVSPAQAQSHTREQIEVLAQYYAQYYGVPLELVRRVINRESTFNPSARNGPYYGLMQILPATARTMGFRGEPSDLLNAETNLIYAVKYLRGAWMLANGSHDRAVQLYAKGYYYEAKAAGLLEETGLRPGPATPATPAPPQFAAPVVAAVTPAPAEAAPAADPIQVAAIEEEATIAPLGFLPPARPMGLEAPEDVSSEANEALVAIAAAEAPPALPARPDVAAEPEDAAPQMAEAQEPSETEEPVAVAAASPEEEIVDELRPSVDLVASTFALLDSTASARR
ncbi:lytic transglycosylase domain-containing protein [Pelagibacterium sp. 26DY04]|uniref:transglycosylase SLT domain-containing protein n=1 Tax=Pelagibacterium sp. 26DY04 TaxID=2967130 RepID=UPI00291D9E90|nr:lytic transglycosylase domain-containing protein [Pelagibacterium sp. 26DY04]